MFYVKGKFVFPRNFYFYSICCALFFKPHKIWTHDFIPHAMKISMFVNMRISGMMKIMLSGGKRLSLKLC